MKVLNTKDREKYLLTQSKKTTEKFRYCKFSFADAKKYLEIIDNHNRFTNPKKANIGPILSLGVRNGREVDLFRIFAYSFSPLRKAVSLLERKKRGVTSWIPFLESIGRSDFNNINNHSSFGVELSPLAARKDIWIGSFDEVPKSWYGKFEILYTNAFDHSFDPLKTIEVWKKLLAPDGYMIFCFPQDQTATELDNVADVNLRDVLNFFPGKLIYHNYRGSAWHYSEYIIQIP